MSKRLCPVCNIGWIRRSEVHTCSPTCGRVWRDWTPERRAERLAALKKPVDIKVLLNSNTLGKEPELMPVSGDADSGMPDTLKKWLE